MAKTKISEFSSNPALNTDIDGINIGEGMLPSNVNNSFRELMSQLKNQQDGSDGSDFTVGGNLTVAGSTTVAGATIYNGTQTFNGAADFNSTANFDGAITATSTANLGSGVTIAGGTVNNTTIGATTANTVRGTTITATTGFTGNLTGNVTGNVTGNLTGNADTATSATTAGSATSATNTTNVGITDDTTTNATMYPTWVTSTTGNLPEKVSSTKLTFNPSTSTLTATNFVGNLTGNSTTATSATTATNIAGGGANQIAYNTGAGATNFLPAGTSGLVLTSNGSGSAPTWQTGVPSGTASNLAGGAAGKVPYQTGAGTTDFTAVGTAGQVLTSNATSAPTWATPSTGTVTSVAASVPSVFSISGSPITSSGTLAMTYSGTALPVANGGTGLTSPGTSGNVLTSNGTGFVSSPLTVTGSGGATASGSVVLTSASSGAQSITPSNYGQTVTLPDATTMTKSSNIFNIANNGLYTLEVVNNAGTILGFIEPFQSAFVGLADNSTAAGVWTITGLALTGVTAQLNSTTISNSSAVYNAYAIDSDRTLFLVRNATSLYGIIYTSSTQTWGSWTVIRATATLFYNAILTAINQFLVVSAATTAFEAVVLTLSGNSITVGIAATATLAGNITTSAAFEITLVGSSIAISYCRATNINAIRALTISGTTVTIGTETTLTGTTIGLQQGGPAIYTVSTSVLLAITMTSATAIYATPYTISGTTITAGTTATISRASLQAAILTSAFGSRWLIITSDGTNVFADLISVAGTTATASSVTLFTGVLPGSTNTSIITSGNKALVCHSQATTTLNSNIITDTSGTASVGTAITLNAGAGNFANVNTLRVIGNNAIITCQDNTNKYNIMFDISNSSPTLFSRSAISITGSSGFPTRLNTNKNIQNPSVVTGATNQYSIQGSTPGVAGNFTIIGNQYISSVPNAYGYTSLGGVVTGVGLPSNICWIYNSYGNTDPSSTLQRIEVV